MVEQKYPPLEQSDMAPESGHSDQAKYMKRSETERRTAEAARAHAPNQDVENHTDETTGDDVLEPD